VASLVNGGKTTLSCISNDAIAKTRGQKGVEGIKEQGGVVDM